MSETEVREVKSPEFAELIAGGRPVLADFYGAWCGSCSAAEPVVARLAERYRGRVRFIKVSSDGSPALAERHGVISLPTFLLLSGSREAGRVVGACGEYALAELIERHLLTAAEESRRA